MKFATKAIHVGSRPDPETGAVIPPIYMTSTFVQDEPGEGTGYEYTRAGNPNFTSLEQLLASLEGGEHATVFSSGLGALTALISTLKPQDKVVAIDGLYGGTYRLFTKVFNRFGIQFECVRPEKLEEALVDNVQWLIFETPTNPLLEIFDIEALTAIAKRHGVRTLVDNTFATPYFQSPLALGADCVWHSTTKYIGGHSDVIGGVLITNDDELKAQMDFQRMAIGVNPSPFDVWLTTRGVKTLAIRMEQHQKNALAFAQFLETDPEVENVYYPGLESHPNHSIARKQMRGYSGIVSVEFRLSLDDTKELIRSFTHFHLAESLGGVESLVNHPSSMTHASIPREERLKMGISDGLVRFSVGIEDCKDLIKDFKHASSCKKRPSTV